MSKNITIQEGSVAKQLTADKLKTNIVGGGTCLWVPEDETQLGTKIITENGTYKASDDGYYGYSEVTVNVPGGAGGPPGGRGSSIVGKDGDGDDAIVTVDPETGELEEEKLPNHIHVVTPPYNPRGIYADGETIDVGPDSGFEVVALLADNSLYEVPGYPMGHIPLSELTVEPTVADYSQTSGSRASEYSEFGQGPWPQPVNSCMGRTTAGQESGGEYYPEYLTVESPGYIAVRNLGNNNYDVLLCSSSPGTGRVGIQIGTLWPQWQDMPLSRSYTYDGKTVYYSVIQLAYASAAGLSGMNSTVDGSSLSNPLAAWVAVYGTETQAANVQTINVSWPRPGDGQVLETTFEIRVAPSPSGDDDN